MADDNKLKFESSDYYGPDLELEVDCSTSAVIFRMKGNGGGVLAELDYQLIMSDQVEKVIEVLTLWRERERERTGR